MKNHKMYLIILSIVVLFERAEQLAFPIYAVNYTRHHHCDFDWKLMGELLLYKPAIDLIMNTVLSDPIANDFYEKYTKFIDTFGPRPSGSDTLENAIDYMFDLTIDSGFYDVNTEELSVPHWQRGYESLTMVLPRPRNLSLLGLGYSVATPPEGITAELLILKNFIELNYYNCTGRIVLFNSPFTTYEKTIKYRVDSASKAARKGAVAVLVRSITPFSLYTPHTGALQYKDGIKKIPAAAITLEDADFLQRVHDRGERIVVNLKMLNTFEVKVSRNTILELEGGEYADKSIIVSGHIDSWDVGTGAIDDGGGMMISWFVPIMLRYLNFRPRRTIKSILWTAEEFGYIGAAAYLEQHKEELHNIDFVMESDGGTFEPLGLEVAGSRNVKCLIANILKLFAPIDKLKDVNSTGTDIILFENYGIPGASLLNKDDYYFWYHHTNADTLTVQNKTNVMMCAAFWAAISYVIADIPHELLNKI